MKLSHAFLATFTIAGIAPIGAIAQQLPADLLPHNAKPGQCYARVLTPAKYEVEKTFDVPVEDTYVVPKVEQAELSPPVVRDVIVKDGYETFRVIEPKWGSVQEKIIITPEHKVLTVVPPSSRQGVKTYVIRKPNLVWRRGADLSKVQRINDTAIHGATGETYCLVEEYGRTQNVPYTFYSAKKAEVRTDIVKEKSFINTRHVVLEKARVEPIIVEAVRDKNRPTVTTQTLVRDAYISGEYETRARTTTITTEKKVSDEAYSWVEVPCDNSMAQATPVNFASKPVPRIEAEQVAKAPVAPQVLQKQKSTLNTVRASDVQKRLAELGYYRGPIDNIYGSLTKEAMKKFQAKSGFVVDGKPSVESLKALGF